MGSFSFKGVSRRVSKLKTFRQKASTLANQKFLREKRKLISDFENHPVTQELRGGINAPNLSRTLPGGYGNLFSFIGFEQSSDPVDIVRDALDNAKIQKNPKKQVKNERVIFKFIINYPTLHELKSVTRMPWEAGLSWLDRVEKGISGFGYYMQTQSRRFSRSGGGVQLDKKVRSGGYSPVSYYSGIINRFKKGIIRKK